MTNFIIVVHFHAQRSKYDVQVHTIALAQTPAAAVAAAGGGWVAMNVKEYELLAEALARKKAGAFRSRKAGGGTCGDRRKAIGVIRMVQVCWVVIWL